MPLVALGKAVEAEVKHEVRDERAHPLDNQCPKCGARSRLEMTFTGIICGVCRTWTNWI